MPNIPTESDQFNVPKFQTAEEYATELYAITDLAMKEVAHPEHKLILRTLLASIALQLDIYHELKELLTKTGSKT